MDITQISLPCREFGNFDVVVVGGGCTGLFAAIRAARLGLRAAVVEKNNCFGGTATAGLVSVWHTLFDVDGEEQIIAGLTEETEHIMLQTGHAQMENTEYCGMRFDPNAMKWALDKLAVENGIKVFFHTFYNSLTAHNGKVENIIVGNKDGLGIIRGDFFIDATGDGDLCRDLGIPSYTAAAIQPPSPCYFFNGNIRGNIGELVINHGSEFGLDDDWGWSGVLPGLNGLSFRADFHIFDKMCNRAEDLTAAEIEGRKKIYAFASLLKKYDNPQSGIAALCTQIGVRETAHYETAFKATERALLLGEGYEDTVMRGSYRVDIHHQHDNGITFKYLDGRKTTFYGKRDRMVSGNWREEEGITGPYAKYYQLPFKALVQTAADNFIPVGRMIHADEGAFGALRVMVNLNQLGEAAGTAAYLALQENKPVRALRGKKVKELLIAGGSRL